MAVTTDNWYLISFLPYSDVAWTGITPDTAVPDMPGRVHASVLAGTTKLYYCLTSDGTDATLVSAADGKLFQIPLAVVDSETLQTKLDQALTDGSEWTMVRDSGGSLLWYDERLGEIRKISTPGALATFAT